jgi:capsular exopolysaccharide synthesis family protein
MVVGNKFPDDLSTNIGLAEINNNSLETTNNYFNNTAIKNQEGTIEAEDLLRALLRNWYWILLCMLLSAAIATIYLRYTIPIYQASSKILIKGDPGSGGTLSEEAVLQEIGVLKPSTDLNNEIQILKSRTLMQQVVEALGLQVGYFGLGVLKSTELYKNVPVKLDSVKWGGTRLNAEFEIKIKNNSEFTVLHEEVESQHSFSEPFTLSRDTFYLSRNLSSNSKVRNLRIETGFYVMQYLKNLQIKVAENSDVLVLEMQDPIREKAKDILNELFELYNQATIDDKNQVAKKTLDFINERLKLLTEELSVVEGGLEDYKENNNIPTETPESVNILLGEVSSYDNALTQLQIQAELLNSIEESLNKGIAVLDFIPSNIMVDQGEGLNLEIERYNTLVLARERIERSAQADNPELISINNQLENARKNVLENLSTLRLGQELTIRENEAKLQRLQARINQIPRQQRELLEIKRQQNIKEELYLFLLQKFEETALSAAITVPNARLIDAPLAGPIPISPIPLQVYAVSLLLGLVIPIGLITLREIFDDNIYREDNLKSLTNIPVLGGIPWDKTGHHVVVRSASRTAIAETFRLLRTNLNYLFRSSDKTTKSLLVTSAQGGDGKTFICINLGISISLTNKRVVLVGMDLRKPKLAEYFLKASDVELPGLTNFLIGDNSVYEIVQASAENENLFVVASGPVPPNPAELLSKDKLSELFSYLNQEFDYIIIDTAPVSLVADAFLLEQYVDHTLFVTRSGKTKKGAISMFEQIRADKKLPDMAIVLNGIKKGKGTGYGYDGYGYGYDYGYYSDEKVNKRKFWPWSKKKQ